MSDDREISAAALTAYKRFNDSKSSHQLDRLLTESEKMKIGRRILIAQAIMVGKTRMEINNKIGVSPNTFRQIRKWIDSEFTAYDSAYKNTKFMESKSKPQSRTPFSYTDMCARYPGHFLLVSEIKKLFTDQ